MEQQQTIQISLLDYFKDVDRFTIKEAEEVANGVLKLNVKTPSVRARIYEGLEKGLFNKLARGVYKTNYNDCECLLINGNGRDLSMIDDSSIDAIITDHPYFLSTNKGGNRNFADTYDCFQYTEEDFKEKHRVLKQGAFLVEFLPEESGHNWEYLTQVKELAKKIGLNYYAKVSWVKGNQVNNTGRKSSNVEDVIFFTKGKARELRLDTKKNLKELNDAGVSLPSNKSSEALKELLLNNDLPVHFMSGTNGMLPTSFVFEPPKKNVRIHQAQKPKELYKEITKYITKEFEIIVDQFGGSCKIAEASLEENRNCVVFEIDKTKIDLAIQMLEKSGMSFKILEQSKEQATVKELSQDDYELEKD